METLTNSRAESFTKCRKLHWYQFEVGLRPTVDAKALRMGTAFHAGLDTWRKTGDGDQAVESARAAYGQCPKQFEATEWEIEVATVSGLVSAYCWRWNGDRPKVIASELSFRLPLVNPATGAKSTVWELAGKLDAITEMPDGRLMIEENKTVSEEVGIEGNYWRRLAIAPQTFIYLYAARQLGYDCASVIYDLTRKPTIKPTNVAVCDDLGAKIVLDTAGQRVKTARGEWRQTGSEKDGYTLQTRPMTPDEWCKKLAEDIGERPSYYFARNEVARIDADIDETLAWLWDMQLTIREAHRSGRHFKTVGPWTCDFCSYFQLCCSRWNPEYGPETNAFPYQNIPEGFQIVSDRFPELAVDSMEAT